MFTTINDAFQWIESFANLEKKPDLKKRFYRIDKMKKILSLWGNPQNSYKILHLAGSKGKGSTATILSGALQERGFKTGLFTSPHILHYKERIKINGHFLEEKKYINCINKIKEQLEEFQKNELKNVDDPSTFELLTLLGFLLFKEENCDWAVIETGLGGRLDATNTVDPEAVFITPIEKEHTQWLGDTLEKIAFEKGGIIKQGKPVFCANQKPEVLNVLKDLAIKKEAPFYDMGELIEKTDSSISGKGTKATIHFKKGPTIPFNLKLIGEVQAYNGALAFLGLKTLFTPKDEAFFLKGMAKAVISGRMEQVQNTPPIIIDGAHTPNSLSYACKDFQTLYSQKDRVLIFACQDDKDIEKMAPIAASYFDNIIITSPGFFKKSHPEAVYDIFLETNKKIKYIKEPYEAFKFVEETFPQSPLLIAGSFYLGGEACSYYAKEKI